MSLSCKLGMETIAQSRTIILIIGAEAVEYNVHEAALANRSHHLDIVLSGLRELANSRVVWNDVDVDTSAKFLDYIYTGDFTIVDPKMKQESESEDPPSLGELMNLVDPNPRESIKYAIKHFGAAVTQPCSEGDAASTSAPQEIGPSHSRDYYRAHCSLYLLAHRYGLEELKSLCIGKMRQSLVGNPCQVELVYAVVDVLRAVWPQTRSGDAMRRLVLQYILTNMSWMMDLIPLIKLLDEIPEVARELVFMMPPAYWNAL